MKVTLRPETAELIERYLARGVCETPGDFIDAAMTYFAMTPDDWARVGREAKLGVAAVDEGRVLEVESSAALMEYLEARHQRRHRDAS